MKKYEFDCPECSHVITITSKSLDANPKITTGEVPCPTLKFNWNVSAGTGSTIWKEFP